MHIFQQSTETPEHTESHRQPCHAQSVCYEAYREVEDIGKLGESIQHTCYDCKSDVGAQHSKGGNAGKVPEELLLLYRNASIKDDRRQQVPASCADNSWWF